MFWGDKQAHAASEGSLGKAMVVCALACVATRPDKSPAVGSWDCLHHTVFRDMRCVSQCRWSMCGWMARCPESCTASEPITAVIYKHWHRRPLDAFLQHGGTTGHGSIREKSAMLKDADLNGAAQCRGPAHSLCAQNNEAVILPVAMTIWNDCTVNTDQD